MGDDEVCECQHTFLNCISLLFAFVFSPSLIYTLLYVVRIPTIHFLIFSLPSSRFVYFLGKQRIITFYLKKCPFCFLIAPQRYFSRILSLHYQDCMYLCTLLEIDKKCLIKMAGKFKFPVFFQSFWNPSSPKIQSPLK